jgi:hypothetical protein
VLGDGIAREVITADIQRYLGPDALVRPGHGTGDLEGRPGYWITAYRTLTSVRCAPCLYQASSSSVRLTHTANDPGFEDGFAALGRGKKPRTREWSILSGVENACLPAALRSHRNLCPFFETTVDIRLIGVCYQ